MRFIIIASATALPNRRIDASIGSFCSQAKDFVGHAKMQSGRSLSTRVPTQHTFSLANIRLYYDFDWDGAEAALNKAAALEPGNPDVLYDQSDLREALGHLDEAIELRKQAIALDPLRSRFYTFLGNDLYEARRYDEANATLRGLRS